MVRCDGGITIGATSGRVENEARCLGRLVGKDYDDDDDDEEEESKAYKDGRLLLLGEVVLGVGSVLLSCCSCTRCLPPCQPCMLSPNQKLRKILREGKSVPIIKCVWQGGAPHICVIASYPPN